MMGRGAVLAFPFAVVMTVQGDEGNVSVVAHAERLGVLYSNLHALFLRHYPQVSSRRTKSSLHFEYDARVFLVHRMLKTGAWQEAREELGPNRHGIVCDIGVVQGLYQGAAVVAPGLHAGREPYFRTLSGHEAAPKRDAYVEVRLNYPDATSSEFLKEFRRLLGAFWGNGNEPPNDNAPGRRLAQ